MPFIGVKLFSLHMRRKEKNLIPKLRKVITCTMSCTVTYLNYSQNVSTLHACMKALNIFIIIIIFCIYFAYKIGILFFISHWYWYWYDLLERFYNHLSRDCESLVHLIALSAHTLLGSCWFHIWKTQSFRLTEINWNWCMRTLATSSKQQHLSVGY